MRSRWRWIIGIMFVGVLAAACDGSTSVPTMQSPSPVLFCCASIPAASPSVGSTTYHDPAGWSIDVPAGWHVVPFETSVDGATAHGALISNKVEPSPSMTPGYPIQTNEHDLPPGGIALVVGVDDDPSDVQQPPPSPPSPPISLDRFEQGSAAAGMPYMDLLWFTGNGKVFIATIKVGPNAQRDDMKSLNAAVSSLRLDSAHK